MSNLGVTSERSFKNLTSPKSAGLSKKKRAKKALDGRGTQIRLIDAALANWDKVQNKDRFGVSPTIRTQKIKALRTIAKCCAYWISVKPAPGAGASVLSTHRRTQIQNVMAQAIGALGHFDPAERDFAQKKTAAITGGRVTNPVVASKAVTGTVKSVSGFSNPNSKALDGSYLREREFYEDIKGSFQAGAHHYSAAAGAVSNADGYTAQWGTITRQSYHDAYASLMSQQDENHVAYLPKSDRMQYLVMVNGNSFTKPDGTPYATNPARIGPGQDRIGDMWAMDKYGNLFVKSSAFIWGMGFFNHSSFNAGNEVICAGGIVLNNGVLAYIDNQSGHYKPDENRLRDACQILQADGGVNFTNVRVGVLPVGGGAPVNYDGTSFIAGNNNPWDANNDAGLNLSAVIPLE